jgi:type IV pilus assembly protein PilB
MTLHKTGEAALLKLAEQNGWITSDVAQTAAGDPGILSNGASVIDWLARGGLISEEQLARNLADCLHLPFVNLASVALDPGVIGLVREDLAMRYKVVPLRAQDHTLVLATANPLDREALHAIEFATGRRVRAEVATLTAIRDALEHSYHLDEALDAYLRGVREDGEIPVAEIHDEAIDAKSLIRGTELPPVVKLLNLILLEGMRTGASDVHIEADPALVRVRHRIDGILEESFRLPKWVQDPLIARCKVLAKLDITERRVPQDGRIHLRYHDKIIDLRVSSLPTQFGEKVTMRILDPSAAPAGLDALQLSSRDLHCIRQAISRPEGMILVTGPTGSGKTTTLYAMLAEIISPTCNIVTVENPIEYQLRGANQVEINEKQGLTFANTLRSILRQDPDVILVGEIRDSETAEIALRAAQTGHLVLSTLHTNDCASSITRLIDIGVEPYMLASSLHLVIAQRLVRRTCERCAAVYEPDPNQLRALEIVPSAHEFRRGVGCAVCRKTGYAGRRGIFEVMPMTVQLARLIETKATENALRLQARGEGMQPLAQEAAEMVYTHATTAEEVLRVVDVIEEGSRCAACGRVIEESFCVCPHCGTALHVTCSSCGMRLQNTWHICPQCGTAAKRAPASGSSAPSTASAPTGVPEPRRYRALVVDDQADFRRLITFTLEHSCLPISAVAVGSGPEAIAHAQDEPPDLVVLDIMMPEMDGFEVCERLRASVRTAFVPILMLTALDDTANRARGFLAGTDDYIGKPFARAEFLARVRRLLERTYGASLPPEATGAGGVLERPRSEVSAI